MALLGIFGEIVICLGSITLTDNSLGNKSDSVTQRRLLLAW